ncbi:lysis system i-spanin subunit Rz [Pseudomonas chlororaphis]|uniref:lysis system i-spanin subunit Rz n=1 Tax=Pseudomonas chlororaphis TaxID=587753 RepID=UPI002368255C|nr:lysis system i-spanin subunit Rz [Pseudomonas chlororaphis]WDG79992.1 lysis system i-spanin subunit Rz [Pseudomonas chlororaphis]WDG86955.1 lysis system i-spanin subunit Rz [Pseudomonas chlororaphis]
MLREAVFPLLLILVAWFGFDLLEEQRDTARLERDQARDERDGLREAARISAERLAARDEIDLQRTQELTHERNQNQLLRRAVDAGNQRLLVNATCPASATATSGASGVADAGSAELSPDARSDYFTLRDQLALSRQMILGLQDHVRRVCRR